MFTGRVITHQPILKVLEKKNGELQIFVKKPNSLKRKLKKGDSFSIDGVCLTLEKVSQKHLPFFLSQKTLETTQWNKKNLLHKVVNIENPLSLNALLHGHLVTGHIDTTGIVRKKKSFDQSLILYFEIPNQIKDQLFENASIAINGVSLTIHKINGNQLSVHLIPETIKKTNLSLLKKGDRVNLETDFFVKGIFKAFKGLKRKI